MKKLITSILSVFLLTSAAYSFDRPSISIGGSTTAAYFSTSAHEVEASEKSEEVDGAALGGYVSVFAEITLADRLSIGVSFVPEDLETETVETKQTDGGSSVTNTIKASLEDMTTVYASLMVTDNLYVKFGAVTLDLVTQENLGTGSAYGNTDLDGDTFGVGYNMEMDNGVFFRAEAMRTNLGGVSLTSTSNSDNKIVLSDVEGVNASIMIGKKF